MASSINLSLTEELRDFILGGYSDVSKGRFVEFSGSLKESIAEAKRRDKEGW